MLLQIPLQTGCDPRFTRSEHRLCRRKPPATDNDWETITEGGDATIKNWIAGQMKGRSCTIVLVGTANRKWINHEIVTSWNADMVNAVVGAAVRAKVEHAFLVTISAFTSGVDKERAKFAELLLHLRDGQHVKEWLKDYTVRTDGGIWIDPHLSV